MPRVPNELISVIVQQVEDVQSLKTCSLVGSVFRIPSQRILLRSLTLQARPPNYTAARHFLEESPHVAAYIAILHILLKDVASSDVESFIHVLGQLKHVRECQIRGNSPLTMPMHILPFSWTYISAQVSSAVHGFLARQSLRRLSVVDIKQLSVSTFFGLLTLAPEITFDYVSILDDGLGVVPSASLLQRLTIRGSSDSIFQSLLRTQYGFHTGALRELGITAEGGQYRTAHALISLVANNLERLELSLVRIVPGTRIAVVSPPPLPVLRCVEFMMSMAHCSGPWFENTILGILAPHSSPLLTQALVTLFPCPVPMHIDHALMTALDNALLAHPAKPSLTWRVPPSALTAAVPWMQSVMPKSHEKGLLIVETIRMSFR